MADYKNYTKDELDNELQDLIEENETLQDLADGDEDIQNQIDDNKKLIEKINQLINDDTMEDEDVEQVAEQLDDRMEDEDFDREVEEVEEERDEVAEQTQEESLPDLEDDTYEEDSFSVGDGGKYEDEESEAQKNLEVSDENFDLSTLIKPNYEKGGKIEEMDWDEIEKQLDGLDDTKKATGSLSPKQMMFKDALEQEYDYRKEKGYED